MGMRKSELMALLAVERDALQKVLGDLPPKRMDCIVVGEGWTVKDVLAHLVAWDREVRQVLERFVRGNLDFGHYIDPANEWAQWNAEMVEQMRQLSGEAVLKSLEEERRLLLGVIRRMDEDQLQQSFHAPWDYTDSVSGFLLAQAAHDRQHCHAIEMAWQAQSKQR